MKTKIICKELKRGALSFYVRVGVTEYFIFQQEFKKSVYDFFKRGVNVNEINDYSSSNSPTVRKTLDKLPTYLHYVEKEFGVEIYEKTKRAKGRKNNKIYKRQAFRWQDCAWAV